MARKPPAHVTQFDGSPFARYNCTAAVGAMELDAATNGARTATGGQIRALQDDQKGGIGLEDLAVALKRGYGLTYTYGIKPWSTARARIASADGVGVQGSYAVVPRQYRAQADFTGGHAVYFVRFDAQGRVVLEDPIDRSGSRTWPEWVARNFYLSGLARAGWTVGSSVSTPPPARTVSEQWLYAWGTLVRFPIGHILTEADIAEIERILSNAGMFDSHDPALGLVTSQIAHGILIRHVGEPWTKALQDKLAVEFGAAATGAGGFGSDIATAIGAIPGAIGQVATNALWLVAILALILAGLWVLIRGDR